MFAKTCSNAFHMVPGIEAEEKPAPVQQSVGEAKATCGQCSLRAKYDKCERSYWTEGMPFDTMNMMIEASGLKPYPSISRPKETIHMVSSDIPVIGDKGLKVLEHVGVYLIGGFEGCTGCRTCEKNCPERALQIINEGNKKFGVKIATEFCLGTACKKCEQLCPEKVFCFEKLNIAQRD